MSRWKLLNELPPLNPDQENLALLNPDQKIKKNLQNVFDAPNGLPLDVQWPPPMKRSPYQMILIFSENLCHVKSL